MGSAGIGPGSTGTLPQPKATRTRSVSARSVRTVLMDATLDRATVVKRSKNAQRLGRARRHPQALLDFSSLIWIERDADARLRELLEGDSRLVNVHGLGGSGASSLVARALADRRFVRIDLEGCVRAADVGARLRRAPERAAIVFLDQVHRPAIARAAIDDWLADSPRRVVVAARGPLGTRTEARVSLSRLDEGATRQLVAAELRRLGTRATPDVTPLLGVIDGWPLAALAAALRIRTLGSSALALPFAPIDDPRCRAVMHDAWNELDGDARALAIELAVARSPITLADALSARGEDALRALVDRALLDDDGERARLLRPFAAFVGAHASGRALRRARRLHVERVLVDAERARVGFRRDPIGAGRTLATMADELMTIALAGPPRATVRAAISLEPLAIGRLDRDDVAALWSAARRAAHGAPRGVRAAISLASVRTLIARGEHETAERSLEGPELDHDAVTAAYRALYRGHVAAWRGHVDRASTLFDEAAVRLADAPDDDSVLDAREDLLLQRIFLAHQRAELDETEHLCRIAAAATRRRSSPRVAAIVRRFVAEAMLRRGSAARAIPLLERSRDELARYGDLAGSIFVWSRLIEALRAAGEAERAMQESTAASRLAARSGEPALELATLRETVHDPQARARVSELSWRAQIPSVRDDAERWLAGHEPARPVPALHLERANQRASLDGKTLALGRRATLWRVLEALADAQRRRTSMTSETLFAIGWPGERAEQTSRKKRVHTAIWTLRRQLLGDALTTEPEGYALSPQIAVRFA